MLHFKKILGLFWLAATCYSLKLNNRFQRNLVNQSATKSSSWTAEGLTQDDLMNKDECIIVDDQDNVIGHNSKYECHRFTTKQPRGLLHRAFSVFIFNKENKLLLQKRASDKITFPDVWTNTCCSHPLFGYQPSELDDLESVQKGEINGIRYGAIRKLNHELGIKVEDLKTDDFKYLTRLHYSSPSDTVLENSDDFLSWGESEIDYILFLRGDFELFLNPEEISETRYVSLNELKEMLSDPKLKWSPWFRIIANNFLEKWWDDLEVTFNSDKYVDYNTIHRLSL